MQLVSQRKAKIKQNILTLHSKTCYTLQRVHATHNDLVRAETKGLVRANRNSPRDIHNARQVAARYVTRRNAESDCYNRCQKLNPCLLFAMLHATCLTMILVIASLLHVAIFRATCFATALRDKLHKKLQRVTAP